MSPQPPKDLGIWDGHTDGAIYWCEQPELPGQTIGHYIWLPDGAEGAGAAIDPVVLAERAVEQMHLVAARAGATPLPENGTGIVGVQTWLWVANDGPASMGPISRTATAGVVSVTATAMVTQVSWDMGNGETVRCLSAGTVWTASRRDSEQDSPTCGYTYLRESGSQPGHAYAITATTHWTVDWSGAGQSGTITFSLTGPPRRMDVVELQALRTS